MDRLPEVEQALRSLCEQLNAPLTDDEAWLRVELAMLLHDLKVLQERNQ